MAAHGKQSMELMQRRKKEKAIFADLTDLYKEIVGKQPSTLQKEDEANARAMINEILEHLKKALEGRYKGNLALLKDSNHELRQMAVLTYAKTLKQICEQLGFSGKYPGVFRGVTELFVPESKH